MKVHFVTKTFVLPEISNPSPVPMPDGLVMFKFWIITLVFPFTTKFPLIPELEFAPIIVLFEFIETVETPKYNIPETVIICLVVDSAAVLNAEAVVTVIELPPAPPVVPAAKPSEVATAKDTVADGDFEELSVKGSVWFLVNESLLEQLIIVKAISNTARLADKNCFNFIVFLVKWLLIGYYLRKLI